MCGTNRTSNRRYRLQNLHRAWYRQNKRQKIQTTESAPCVLLAEQPATEDRDYRICTVRGINRTSNRRYRLQNLHRAWYQQNQQHEIQTTESAPCVVPTEQPATEYIDYRICTLRDISRSSNRRYRLQLEPAPCVVSTEAATEDTDYRICTVRGINRTTSHRRYRLQNLDRAWYQQNNQQQEIQTTEYAP